MARSGPFKDLDWGKLGGNKKSNTPKKTPGVNNQYRTSTMGQLVNQAKEAQIPKKKTGGNYAAVVLRVDSTNPLEAAGSSWMNAWYDDVLGVPKPETIKIKARIPALHAGIPEPDKYGCDGGSGPHQFWINMHPTFYASSQDIEMPECGDIVIVSVNADDGSGGGDAAGGGLIMSTVVTRESNPVKKGGSCPPSETFPSETPSTADGADGDAMGGEEVSASPVSPFGLPADCDFECMMEFLSGISALPPVCPGRDPFGKVTECGSPFDKKGIFISRRSFQQAGKKMPQPMPAMVRALWADIGYVVLDVIEQTSGKDYKSDLDVVKAYARMFALGGINVYLSGTPYPGKSAKFVEYISNAASDLPCKGMVMTPSWGYVSPGNKDKYSRQAKWLTGQMNKAARTHGLQLGFSNQWMPSAQYTVAEVDGEEGAVSIRYMDSFPYYCFSDVDWSIAQIRSYSGKSVVSVNEDTGQVKLLSEKGSEALKQEDFAQVLSDYMTLGFKYIIPGFGVMGTGWEDYRVSAEKPPGRLRAEHDFLGAIEEPAVIGEVRTTEDSPNHLPNPGPGSPGLDVRNWGTGYFGATIYCTDEEIDVDKRCPTPPTPPPVPEVIPEPVPEPEIETVEIPVMEWSDGWADYTIDTSNEITYTSPTSGDLVTVYPGNTSSVFPDGCGECYDAILALRPPSEFVEQVVEAVTIVEEVTSQIYPVHIQDPPIKSKVAWSVTWWDWLNAEEHIPCWKSTRWEVIKNFHRYSPIAYERQQEGGAIDPGDFDQFSREIQEALQAIQAYNRIAETNPAMEKVSLEQYMMAIQQAQAMSSFTDSAEMDSFAEAASSVAQSSATELGYDGEGSASGAASDAASDIVDDFPDTDSYYGSDAADETAATDGAASADANAASTGLDAYPAFNYINFSSPVNGGTTGGWYPAADGSHRVSSRSPASIDHIVIHTTAGASQLAGGEVFCKPGAGVSTHYGINTGGFVFQFVKEKDQAWGNGGGTKNAAPPTSQGGRRNLAGGTDKYVNNSNGTGLSIEITGIPKEEAQQPGKWYTEVMYENLAFLVANMCKRNQIAVDRTHIFGHDEMTMRKSDPGTKLDNPHPEGISYPYAGNADGGVAFPGARFQINSYSPKVDGTETFDWVKFMGLVNGFFSGAGVPTPPSTALAAGSAGGGAGGAGLFAAPKPEQCGPAGAAAGGGGSAPGAPLTAAQVAALGDFQGSWPSGGSPMLSSDFGPRTPPTGGSMGSGNQGSSNHGGLDIISSSPASYQNSGVIPIFAIADGTVQSCCGSTGAWMVIDHGGGMVTKNGHMHNYAVKTGDRVTKGQVVGTMGTTGNSTGVHLHFELHMNGSKVDPFSALGLECNAAAKGHSRYGRLCAQGNQNTTSHGPYTGG